MFRLDRIHRFRDSYGARPREGTATYRRTRTYPALFLTNRFLICELTMPAALEKMQIDVGLQISRHDAGNLRIKLNRLVRENKCHVASKPNEMQGELLEL